MEYILLRREDRHRARFYVSWLNTNSRIKKPLLASGEVQVRLEQCGSQSSSISIT